MNDDFPQPNAISDPCDRREDLDASREVEVSAPSARDAGFIFSETHQHILRTKSCQHGSSAINVITASEGFKLYLFNECNPSITGKVSKNGNKSAISSLNRGKRHKIQISLEFPGIPGK